MMIKSFHISLYLEHLGIAAAHSGCYGRSPQCELYIASNADTNKLRNSEAINEFTATCAILGLAS